MAVGTQTVAFYDSRDSEWIDTSGRYRVRFVFGVEWSGRFEPNCLGSTRGARYESAVVGAQTLAVTDRDGRRLGRDYGDILGGYRV